MNDVRRFNYSTDSPRFEEKIKNQDDYTGFPESREIFFETLTCHPDDAAP